MAWLLSANHEGVAPTANADLLVMPTLTYHNYYWSHLMSSAPDCAALKALFPALYANRRRLRIKDPTCTDFIHLVGTCVYGKSPKTGCYTRLNTVTIGRIFGDQPNGVGKIEFNERFLQEHPQYADVDVYRLNNRPAGVLVVPKGTPVTTQDLANAIYAELGAKPGAADITERNQLKLNALLERGNVDVDPEEIKNRVLVRRRKAKEAAEAKERAAAERAAQRKQREAQRQEQLAAQLAAQRAAQQERATPKPLLRTAQITGLSDLAHAPKGKLKLKLQALAQSNTLRDEAAAVAAHNAAPAPTVTVPTATVPTVTVPTVTAPTATTPIVTTPTVTTPTVTPGAAANTLRVGAAASSATLLAKAAPAPTALAASTKAAVARADYAHANTTRTDTTLADTTLTPSAEPAAPTASAATNPAEAAISPVATTSAAAAAATAPAAAAAAAHDYEGYIEVPSRVAGRHAALKEFLALHGLDVESKFDLATFLTQRGLEDFPELKAELTQLLSTKLGPDSDILQLPWHLTDIVALPSARTHEPSLGASLTLTALCQLSPIPEAIRELVTSNEDATLLTTLIIAAALTPKLTFAQLNDLLGAYQLPWSGPISAKHLNHLSQCLTAPELEAFWRSHNEALFEQLAQRPAAPVTVLPAAPFELDPVTKASKRRAAQPALPSHPVVVTSAAGSGALEPMLLDVRLSRPYDHQAEAAQRRAIAQHTTEQLLAVLSEAEANGTDAQEAIQALDAQAEQLVHQLAETLTNAKGGSAPLQLAALALPQHGALCYCASYEGELTEASSVLYAQGLSLCPPSALPHSAMSIAAPLMVMARPDLSYPTLLHKLHTWRAQGQRLIMELDPTSDKIHQLIIQNIEDGSLGPNATCFKYHDLTLRARKLPVSWPQLYGVGYDATKLQPQQWYLYLYCNEAHSEMLKHILMLNTAQVNTQYQKSQHDLMSASSQVPARAIAPLSQYITPGLVKPLVDQIFQCYSDQSTELDEHFAQYCALHSFKAVLASDDLDAALVYAASAQRAQLEERVRALCTQDGATTNQAGATNNQDASSSPDDACPRAVVRDVVLGEWPQLGSLVALLGQGLYESVEQAIARSPERLKLPLNSVELMLWSLATIKNQGHKNGFALSRALHRPEYKFLAALGLDPNELLGPSH